MIIHQFQGTLHVIISIINLKLGFRTLFKINYYSQKSISNWWDAIKLSFSETESFLLKQHKISDWNIGIRQKEFNTFNFEKSINYGIKIKGDF